jgi:hypothetical protein
MTAMQAATTIVQTKMALEYRFLSKSIVNQCMHITFMIKTIPSEGMR